MEQECDVILAVRTVRQSRSEFVFSRVGHGHCSMMNNKVQPDLIVRNFLFQDQFEYLYDAALEFVNNFTTYSNFA